MEEPVSVLLVEHRSEDARILGDLLASSGAGFFAVEWVNCLLQALSAAEGRKEHQIILLDIDLPDGGGVRRFIKPPNGGGQEAIRQLRTRAGSVPIITLASDDGDAAGTQSIANGAQDHLVKWHFGIIHLTKHSR